MAIDLNEKPWYVAAIVGAVLGVVIFFVMHTYFFKEMQGQIVDLHGRIDTLEREIEKGRQAKADLPKLEEEIRNYQLELDRLTRILPTARETPTLIKRLKQLNELGSFQLNRFVPGGFEDREYYYEWPIKVELDGTYHELGLFFDRLSRFSRIINVSELSVRPMTKKGGPYTIQASFTQRTFIYKEDTGGAP